MATMTVDSHACSIGAISRQTEDKSFRACAQISSGLPFKSWKDRFLDFEAAQSAREGRKPFSIGSLGRCARDAHGISIS